MPPTRYGNPQRIQSLSACTRDHWRAAAVRPWNTVSDNERCPETVRDDTLLAALLVPNGAQPAPMNAEQNDAENQGQATRRETALRIEACLVEAIGPQHFIPR